MSDEHDGISDERKDYFDKRFMQIICLVEGYELMEIVT